MRNRVSTCLKYARAQFVGSALLLLAGGGPGGCVVPPKLDNEGHIDRGHPRLRALVRFIDDQRARSAGAFGGDVVAASYSGVLTPGELSFFYFGDLPGRDSTVPRATYSLAAAGDTIEQAAFSVVTEYLVTSSGRARTCGYLLEWDARQGEWSARRSAGAPPLTDVSGGSQSSSAAAPRGVGKASEASRFVFKDGMWTEEHP